jgi:hypothetical protein
MLAGLVVVVVARLPAWPPLDYLSD